MDEDGKVKCSFLKKLSQETFDAFVHQIDLQKGSFAFTYSLKLSLITLALGRRFMNKEAFN